MIKTLQLWFAKHFFQLFGVFGVLLTLYVGIVQIPYSIRTAKIEQRNRVQAEVEQSIKELAFSDSNINFLEVKFLIDAKEIELGEKFPLGIAQVLTLTQQSFMSDKYLSLEKRRELIEKLESLKASLPKSEQTAAIEPEYISAGALLSILLSIALASLGALSLYKRQKRDEVIREELSNEIEQTEISWAIEPSVYTELENKLLAVLTNKEDLQILADPMPAGKGLLIHFMYQKKYYAALFKFIAYNKIGFSTIKPVLYVIDQREAEVWIVFNTGLTALGRQEIRKYNRQHPNTTFKTIKANTITEFENQLDQLLAPKEV